MWMQLALEEKVLHALNHVCCTVLLCGFKGMEELRCSTSGLGISSGTWPPVCHLSLDTHQHTSYLWPTANWTKQTRFSNLTGVYSLWCSLFMFNTKHGSYIFSETLILWTSESETESRVKKHKGTPQESVERLWCWTEAQPQTADSCRSFGLKPLAVFPPLQPPAPPVSTCHRTISRTQGKLGRKQLHMWNCKPHCKHLPALLADGHFQ